MGSKHTARYGNFADSMPRQKNRKMEDLASRLNLPSGDSVKTGDDLRRSRLRNLKEAQKAIPIIEYTSPPGATRNWSDEEINNAIKCLNLTYGNKPRSELSDDERIGIVNWDEFDKHAETVIVDYTTERVRKNVISWILYHRKKMDIRYVPTSSQWIFDPKNSPKRLYKRLSKKVLATYEK
jgi:hypothetical protein